MPMREAWSIHLPPGRAETLPVPPEKSVAASFRPERSIFVVPRVHLRRQHPGFGLIDEPRDRGTGVAIALAVLRVIERDADALIVLFPHDFVGNPDLLFETLQSAIDFVEDHSAAVLVIGAEFPCTRSEYGWIEPGISIRGGRWPRISHVNRIHERSSRFQGEQFRQSGWLHNTFVTVGYAESYLELLCAEAPDVVHCLTSGLASGDPDYGFGKVRYLDFCRDVLAVQPYRLLAIRGVAIREVNSPPFQPAFPLPQAPA